MFLMPNIKYIDINLNCNPTWKYLINKLFIKHKSRKKNNSKESVEL
ncbi:MAG: hypothetical protein ACD_3C00017G0003 [uncultured bacterium (gcode 4)]|uniref:Uncharacterized protein n=1 Tax=uncultured bacterium (gcode 4) TaxID=1234023 RepID=K2GZ55_9BACT|nr:MAG: hypothetical protein ACD_3C00017G0003 [uncultured bacterium (gcode 4)]